MRILINECLPKGLWRHLKGHDARSVAGLGWSGTKNGELLRRMVKAGFSVILTVDQGLEQPQNIRRSGVAVIIAKAASNSIDDLLPLIPSILLALDTIQPGEVVEVHA